MIVMEILRKAIGVILTSIGSGMILVSVISAIWLLIVMPIFGLIKVIKKDKTPKFIANSIDIFVEMSKKLYENFPKLFG